ncbi:antibiotic biosynthesis monooxygenase [Herbaspirillum sp. LeCh32-8]|uniref:putative quinol monooxygenase n=1 Tax=Herbaspirillum sp. LeCh32-8 TaxID=2821356 RepID=UPI001AE79E70|nr:putative quinol monooxygenase [Herbaspirillum sp. LeCh32-8]MBP0599818.1 antibiotic biosynthesis monooxygenase [Herbaspirillum sp. LeCh32-8]
MLIIAVTFKVKQDNAAAFRAAILKNAATSLAEEAGCNLFDVCENQEGVFYLYERYTDDEAFNIHLRSTHFVEFDKLVAPWVETKKIERYSLISPV